MKTTHDIMKVYTEGLGHSIEAAVVAVYNAGLADGKESQEAVAPSAQQQHWSKRQRRRQWRQSA